VGELDPDRPTGVTPVAFDEDLAARTRAALSERAWSDRDQVFGGLCFTVHGNMAVGVTGGDLMVRLAPDEDMRPWRSPACARWTSRVDHEGLRLRRS
jgi:hypothetical protein